MAEEARIAARWLTVGIDYASQRLDNFLLRELKGVPRKHIYRLVRTGQVRVNSKRMTAATRLVKGDLVRLPPVRSAVLPRLAQPGGLPPLVSDCADFVAFSKPAGLAVHGGSGVSAGLIERLRATYPGERWELAHRLDRATSGLLIVARKGAWLRSFHQLLRTGQVAKSYCALVFGQWQRRYRLIKAPLRKQPAMQGGRRVVIDVAEGKPAVTRTTCGNQYESGAWLEIELLTGRTHQARAHLASVGLPVIGDQRYGDRARNHEAAKAGLTRMHLHARRLVFRIPGTEQIDLQCAPPEDFAKTERWLAAKSL